MPKAPTCRKCGNPHWSTERCAYITADVVFDKPVLMRREGTQLVARIPTNLGAITGLEERGGVIVAKTESGAMIVPKGKRDRKAYMREFMAKKRAKKAPEAT